MIGTSISKHKSVKMFYPSLTICQYGSGSVTFVNDTFFESGHSFKKDENLTAINYTLSRTPDLSDVFLQLTTASPNGPSLVLNRSSVEDRYDHLKQSQEKMRSFFSILCTFIAAFYCSGLQSTSKRLFIGCVIPPLAPGRVRATYKPC